MFYFRKAREDEKSATSRLHDMIANYGDVIPRRDFEMLEKNFNVSQSILGLIIWTRLFKAFRFKTKIFKSFEVYGFTTFFFTFL